MTPKVPTPTVVPGRPKLGVLVTLKNSERNSMYLFSPMGNCLKREASSARRPGARRFGMVRGASPNEKGAGWRKAAVLNHCWILSAVERSPLRRALPATLGRCTAEYELLVL